MISTLEVWPGGAEVWIAPNGKHHRLDGPSIKYLNGTEVWYRNGKLHRDDGPAVAWNTGKKEWWLHNKEYTFAEFIHKKFGNSLEATAFLLRWSE